MIFFDSFEEDNFVGEFDGFVSFFDRIFIDVFDEDEFDEHESEDLDNG